MCKSEYKKKNQSYYRKEHKRVENVINILCSYVTITHIEYVYLQNVYPKCVLLRLASYIAFNGSVCVYASEISLIVVINATGGSFR